MYFDEFIQSQNNDVVKVAALLTVSVFLVV